MFKDFIHAVIASCCVVFGIVLLIVSLWVLAFNDAEARTLNMSLITERTGK